MKRDGLHAHRSSCHGISTEKRALRYARLFFHKRCISNYRVFYFLLHSLGVTQVPVALQTTIGSSKKSAAEALMSGLA